jgi:hypothetical protein
MKLDKRHKWASSEDGELVFYQCVVCGEERTETVLAAKLRQSIELIRNDATLCNIRHLFTCMCVVSCHKM